MASIDKILTLHDDCELGFGDGGDDGEEEERKEKRNRDVRERRSGGGEATRSKLRLAVGKADRSNLLIGGDDSQKGGDKRRRARSESKVVGQSASQPARGAQAKRIESRRLCDGRCGAVRCCASWAWRGKAWHGMALTLSSKTGGALVLVGPGGGQGKTSRQWQSDS